ncbi:MAG: M64 family metallopeptidase [Acidobacteriota bacterium]
MTRALIALALSAAAAVAAADPAFDAVFVDRTLRVDYVHVGDASSESATLDQLYEQGAWAGSTTSVIDELNLGRYMVKVYDLATNRLIFSKGFDSYFGEYRTTSAALAGARRAYHETVLMPMPRGKVQFTLEARDRSLVFRRFFDIVIDPAAIEVNREGPRGDAEALTFLDSGDPHQKVDILFVAEGYTGADRAKFKGDAERLTKLMFAQEPYKSRRALFNVRGIYKASADRGCDEPSHGSYKRTVVGSSFDSLGVYRYLLVEDNRALRDLAAHAPYDALYILVNTARYGGGGIYNWYCTTTSNNQYTDYVFLHEFGHSFAGLADEYYASTTAYNEFYPRGSEPLEANITALLNPPKVKWSTLLSPGIQVPTRWEKADFDKMDSEYQKVREEVQQKIAALKRAGGGPALEKLEAESERMAADHAKKVDEYLAASKYAGKVGVFEGAGYSSGGLYRPSVDCIMFSKGVKPFCPVCQAAIVRVIESYAR